MKKRNTLISVAMTTYNGEKFIKEQMDSILNQTYKNIEIVVCDDCSTDKTIQILNEYAKKYHNIKVYQNSCNTGVNKNFEEAIRHCEGEYIAISDQDDVWNSDKLELLINNIENCDIICSKKTDIDENNNIMPDIHFRSFELAKTFRFNKTDFLKIFYANILWGCTSLIKKSFLVSCFPFPPEVICYDQWICLNSHLKKSIKYIDTDTIRHKIHSSNVTRNLDTKNPYLRWFKNLNKEVTKKYYKDYIDKIDLLIERLPLQESYRQELLEIKEIYNSVLNFRFSKKDFILLKKEYNLYKKLNRRRVFIIKSAAERIILAFFSYTGYNK